MNENISRRHVLKTVSTTGALSVFAAASASGAELTARIIETGIHYEVPDGHGYDGAHVDSRPPYTVDAANGRLLVAEGEIDDLRQSLESATGYVGDDAGTGSSTSPVRGAGQRVSGLPTSLTTRMRVQEMITLVSDHELPTVTVDWDADGAAVTTDSAGRVDLSTGDRTSVALDPETVEAQTVRRVDPVGESDVPEHMRAKQREFGSVEIEATPVVEAVDHGELTVESLDAAGGST